MSKFIDSEKLKAEIERHIKEVKEAENRFHPNLGFFDAKLSGIYDTLHILESLQQEQSEVDIEKEIAEHAENMPHGEFTHESECIEHEEWAKREFHHFYELGLNARKEK